jgi:hypothetical protein
MVGGREEEFIQLIFQAALQRTHAFFQIDP